MNNASLELGGTNWAEKEGSLLGYAVNDTNNKYSAKEFTFGRGTNLSATRIGQTGLIEKGRENVLLQSNQFDTTWLQNRIDLTSGQSGYDSDSDAWKLESNNASTTYLSQSVAASGVQTASLYAKAGTADYFAYYTSAGVSAWFNLSNGSIGNTGSNIDTQIEDVGNGWYRCSMSYNASISYVRIYLTDANGSFTSAVGSNILIQDAQIEQGLVASPYIPTTTTTAQAGVLENTPRLNYTTGVANPYLLLEPGRTNAIYNSEYYDGSDWSAITTAVTSNSTTSPEGLVNATKLVPNNGATGAEIRTNDTANVTSGQKYVFSTFAKAAEFDKIQLDFSNSRMGDSLVVADLTNGTITLSGSGNIDQGIEPYGNGWYRIYVVAEAIADGTTARIFRLEDNPTGDGTSGIYVYGSQWEALASYPTSYIPTYSTSATRAADSCSKTDASGVVPTAYPFSMFAEVDVVNTTTGYAFSFLKSTSSAEYFTIEYFGNVWHITARPNGPTERITSTTTVTKGTHKLVGVWESTSMKLYLNGSLIASGSNSQSFNSQVNSMLLGQLRISGDTGSRNSVRQASLYNTALTNAEAITLTTI